MKPIILTAENYSDEVNNYEKPVLIDFYADWCGPCRMVAPVIAQLAEEVKDAKICKVNVDEQNSLAAEFGIMSIPTLVILKNGRIVNKAVGVQSKEALLKMIASA